MGTTERVGILTHVDESGNMTLLYPVTTKDAVDGLDEALNNYLSNSGGTMNGNINMNGKQVTGVATPKSDSDASTKKYVDDKNKTFTVTLTKNDWDGTDAPYKQTIGIAGILGTDRPHYGPVYSEDTSTMLAEKEAWMLVDDLDTADGSVTFTCLEDKPQTSVTVQMEVHR